MSFIGLVFATTLNLSALTVDLTPPPTPKEIWIEELHSCENRNNRIRILDSNDKYSYGYVMFQMDTWLAFGKKFGATRENINDEELQKVVAESMLDKGLWRHWRRCALKTKKKIGEYPI